MHIADKKVEVHLFLLLIAYREDGVCGAAWMLKQLPSRKAPWSSYALNM